MSDEVIETEAVEVEETATEEVDVWDQVLSPDTEVTTKVWICTYAFPVTVDNEGNELPEGETATAGETFASTSKSVALTRLFNVIMSVDAAISGFEVEVDTEKEDWQLDAIKQFFTRDNVNLNLTLVDLI